jgi:hypothetical protein
MKTSVKSQFEHRVKRAQAKLAKAEAKLAKTEAKLETRKAKVLARRRALDEAKAAATASSQTNGQGDDSDDE